MYFNILSQKIMGKVTIFYVREHDVPSFSILKILLTL